MQRVSFILMQYPFFVLEFFNLKGLDICTSREKMLTLKLEVEKEGETVKGRMKQVA